MTTAHNSGKSGKIFAMLVATAGMAISASAAEIATDPGDYQTLPAGANLGLIYYQHTERDTLNSDGKKVPAGVELTTDIGLARFVHFTEVGGYIIDPQIIVPFGSVELDAANGGRSASGIGDPIIGGTWWLLSNSEARRWFGISAFVSVPVGNYDANKDAVNIGQNRWKGIFQAGYVTGLGGHFMLDLIGETAIYGDNTDYGVKRATLSQQQSYSLQGHLRYLISPTTHVAMSYFHDFGGETEINGTGQKDEMDNSRWQATFATFLTPSVQLQLQYGQSIDVENGFEEKSRFNARVLKVF